MPDIVDFILHSDRHLLEFVGAYGGWVYALLFVIVFAETGFVVTPFLPGDSLLFATGALCASGALNTPTALVLLAGAAFSGNAVNYTVGRLVGPRVFNATDQRGWAHRLLNRDHLRRANVFFETYGGKAVILGRFVPIVKQNFSLVTIGIVLVSLLPVAVEYVRHTRGPAAGSTGAR